MASSELGLRSILLTVPDQAGVFPLSATSYRCLANMRAVAPKLQLLRETSSDEPSENCPRAMGSCNKKEKINPLGGGLRSLRADAGLFTPLYWTLMESGRDAPGAVVGLAGITDCR